MPLNSKQAGQIAQIMDIGFTEYRVQFEEISSGAKRRFEKALWQEVQASGMQRIDLYGEMVNEVTKRLDQYRSDENIGQEKARDWVVVKAKFEQLMPQRTDPEMAETFYNSIFCRTFRHRALREQRMFLFSSTDAAPKVLAQDMYCEYDANKGVTSMVSQILDDYCFDIPYVNKRLDVVNLVRNIKENTDFRMAISADTRIQILKSVFYRNKGAYLVGQLVNPDHRQPFVVPLLNDENHGIYTDTLITDSDDVSIIFSFTRSYFMVKAPVPAEFVGFLQQILPAKPLAEIYTNIGFFKHGKSVFMRDYLQHMDESEDQFIIAPGIKGMVMSVFTLPSLDIVFKIIKDKFAPPKAMTKAVVKEKYRLVKVHDRVGRMADTQEFKHFAFAKHRFSQELIDELFAVAPSMIQIVDEYVVIEQLYVERRMIPLNIYIDTASDDQLYDVIDEYGNAIKQLAAANIFPGDMLFKNFGVTRHGRVVFYDYDEICYLTECNFRKIPEPMYPEQELASEPWYSVGPYDVFPEEFHVFLAGRPRIAKIFRQIHSDIFDADYWQSLQRAIEDGQVKDVFPYRRKKRFLSA
ncbi:bifunctional isocitrate dehydrogenase kinase/phosphatase [Candidatus Njordibacter sp. Uisw_039]|jgi:isocitrate dehydrogenase kinase/phosphatase|uniref:bifunctional isocitrate dehydrogenase kinase/phosphatase n=1 Tax=Candidatus Njordibacter sp. Uisw_039 TaxID=3230972 RepID=UPI003A40673D|tara:strand:- start:3876 stop:5612 length:1737 start_codon:yes stop_codon:yes gene_type:complete